MNDTPTWIVTAAIFVLLILVTVFDITVWKL